MGKPSNKPFGFKTLRLLTVLVAASLLAGCLSGKTEEPEAYTENDADRLFNEGLALSSAGNLKGAEQRFREVDKAAPYSDTARKSLIMQAYTNYTLGRYQETVNASQRFLTLYPGNDDAPYAQYLIGQSYFAQMPSVVQDQSMTERALQAMEELIRRYPESEYVGDARKKILATQDQLAGKEMDIGRYYQSRHNHSAAINRFRNVVVNYQQTRHVEEALARLTESYYALGVVEEAQTAAAVLGHNFPDSKWYENSHELLQTGGYDPTENKSSWMSRAFDVVKLL